jgi:transposase-like protein
MPDHKCPLCESNAKAGGIDYGRKLQFLCKNCSRFVITMDSENDISSLDEKVKKSFILEALKCKSPLILHIYRDENKCFTAHCKPESDLS